MPNYKNSQIYMIWSPSNPDVSYIGSTTQSLAVRMAEHRRQYKRYLAGTCKTNYSSFRVLECGDARIELIEEVKCENRKQLQAIEGKYIRERKCCNKVIAGRSKKEYHQDNKQEIKEYRRQYRQTHKEEINKYNQKYYQDNKQKINEHNRQYRKKHIEKIREYEVGV